MDFVFFNYIIKAITYVQLNQELLMNYLNTSKKTIQIKQILKPNKYIILPYTYKQLKYIIILQAYRLQNIRKNLKVAISTLYTTRKMAN